MLPLIIVLQLVLSGPVVMMAFLNNRVDHVKRLSLQKKPNCCVDCCRGVGTFFVGILSFAFGAFGALYLVFGAFFKYLFNFIW